VLWNEADVHDRQTNCVFSCQLFPISAAAKAYFVVTYNTVVNKCSIPRTLHFQAFVVFSSWKQSSNSLNFKVKLN
jgi:hypothetical protein